MRIFLAGALVALSAACSAPSAPAPVAPTTFAEENPERLSAWGMLTVSGDGIAPSAGVAPYGLETPLFSDYAQKLRTIWLPEGAQTTYTEGLLDLPVGTVLTKTFYYPEGAAGTVAAQAAQDLAEIDPATHRIIETRLLVRRADGWEALVYLWNAEETDATLSRAGGRLDLVLAREGAENQAFTYTVPNVTQCAACHAPNATTRTVEPIGPTGRNLNRDYPYAEGHANQLARLAETSWLQGIPGDLAAAARLVSWTEETAPLDARARAYLDLNCAHCHNAVGPADTSGLRLEASAPFGAATGLCKLPVAAGAGTGNLRFDIVPGRPEESILIYRLHSEDPAVMMPEIGRATAHREGVALLSQWIAAMEGSCS